MKIALGTVQWGMKYGISNKKGIPSDHELDAILLLAREEGINLLDTASGYGSAENRIGVRVSENFRIVTKIGSITSTFSIEQQVKKSLENLNTSTVYGCLFHNVNELLESPFLWEEIQVQKKEGRIEKVGYSLYRPEELEKLLQLNFIPDLIQIPFNLIDQRFEPYFKQLSEMKIEIHVRSIFLQGLLLNFEMMEQDKFLEWSPIWKKYKDWLNETNLTPLEACICHAKHHKEITNIILGVEQLSQLKEIILASKKKSIEAPKAFISTDQKLINPLSWL
ncbi:aldo/keto reductase [Flavobacteriaceae bacterium]|nr:aldo/keto reductase [Flavobacteriaceae bacterium]